MDQSTISKTAQGYKRILDIIICCLFFPVVLCISLILSILIFLDTKGSVLYRQERIGKNGKPFLLYKFRTMYPNAEQILEDMLEKDENLAKLWKADQKLKEDPRLTRIGYFLRKTSLDELPQIWNILKGEMTLVGPRPIVESEKEKYGRYFEEYCSVRPGLTGLWQTSGRNDTTYSQRVAYDHYYINHWSPWLDLIIMAKTIPVAISGRGAY